ncbi:ECF RNA polymerase sigma factor SigE [Novipirellula artificiosorum]|uniref:ECF RNA polymerase sigma factor SigE n=1 Tax=Novipirellula artificiosorum TaxID=2528016 RepID=A0A5C6DQS6_9BACT|nr:ECF RNA polymerase sigma factor SigE [Novipirellula artificiosorum]
MSKSHGSDRDLVAQPVRVPGSGLGGAADREGGAGAGRAPSDQAAAEATEPNAALLRRNDAEHTAEELIRRHQRGVWRYLRMLGCDASTADDLTQETFLRVLRRDNFIEHNDAATSGYLRRTAHNLLVSRHRKLGRMHSVPDLSDADYVWDRWAGKDLNGDVAVDSLRFCLELLTERAQLALRMRYQNESSRIEIANALEITDHGARNLMQRAKQQLRECVEQRLQDEKDVP